MSIGARDPDQVGHTMAGDECPDIEASTEGYASRFAGPVGNWFLEVQARATLELLAPLAGPLRILDVGGGHGQLVPPLLAAGHEVVVVGSTASCAARLTPWLVTGRCTFQVGRLLDLPFAAGEFDVALSLRTLSHLSDWKRLVAELCRVSRLAALLDYPSLQSVNRLADPLFPVKVRVEGNTRRFDSFHPIDIAAAFEEHGYRISAARAQFILPMALHRLLGSAQLSRALESPARSLGLTATLGSPVIVRAEPLQPKLVLVKPDEPEQPDG